MTFKITIYVLFFETVKNTFILEISYNEIDYFFTKASIPIE